MLKVGDIVRYLNAVGGGRVSRVEGAVAYVDDDGFVTPVLAKECVVVTPAKDAVMLAAEEPATASKAAQPKSTPAQEAASVLAPFVETEEGELLNVVLGFEAKDIKHLSATDYEAFLVNDSNYHLYYVISTQEAGTPTVSVLACGTIEPAMQEYVATVEPADLPAMDRISVDIIAFKPDRPYRPKRPVSLSLPFDTTKFFKLHCFKRHPYFDNPVIAIEIVKDDVPVQSGRTEVDAASLAKAMSEKKRADSRRDAAPAPKKNAQKSDAPVVVDLHIHELVDNTAGLSNADMLNMQIDRFRAVMDENLRHHGRKIVFIHGKGEGVLRQALLKELNHKYKGHDVQDASFREYGFGATQVTIR